MNMNLYGMTVNVNGRCGRVLFNEPLTPDDPSYFEIVCADPRLLASRRSAFAGIRELPMLMKDHVGALPFFMAPF